jgi:hypothetical protein
MRYGGCLPSIARFALKLITVVPFMLAEARDEQSPRE